MISRVADRWRKSYLVSAFEGWAETHAETTRRKRIIGKTMERAAQAKVRAAFRRWNEQTAELIRQRALLTRVER